MMAFLAIGANAQMRKTSDSRPVGEAKTKPVVVKAVMVEPTSSIRFVATAYSLRGRMANGEGVHAGAIAADPRVLPINSVVFIEGMGTFVVKDTGGDIKGRRIDIWMSSRKNALKWGRRTVVLKIISKGNRKTRT